MTVEEMLERPTMIGDEFAEGTPVKDYWEFVHERECIRVLREQGLEAPWTADPVMSSRFFTNVFREDDPGTHVAVAILSRTDRPKAERLWNLIRYRRFNREATWRDLMGYIEWGQDVALDFRAERDRLQAAKDDKLALFTDAHQVYPLVQLAEFGDDLLSRVMVASWRDATRCEELARQLEEAPDIKACFKAVKNAKLPGIAGFLAWQLVLDCRYGPDPIVRHSDDVWAPVQAGCRIGVILNENWPARGIVNTSAGSAGLSRAKREQVDEAVAAAEAGDDDALPILPSIRPTDCEAIMRDMRDRQDEEFGIRDLDFLAVSGGRRLTIAALEHSLCEVQKYWGVARGMPHSKRAFK